MTVPPQLQKVFERIDAMSLRERAMVAATVLGVLWATWDGLLMRPLGGLEQARQEQLRSATQQVVELTRTIQMLAAERGAGPEGAARQQLAELRARNVALDERLREVTRELVEPGEMAGLLEQLLVQTGNLQLVGMTTLAPEPIVTDAGETGYFRHGLELRVRGSYLDALRYLEAIERLRWNFFWDRVEIRVVRHPSSQITIIVHTLGSRPGVIGV